MAWSHEPVEAFPLTWPAGRARTAVCDRKVADFGKRESNPQGGWRQLKALTLADGMNRLMAEIRCFTRSGRSWRINPAEVVVSTNVPLRRDGMPYSSLKEPLDAGVAVYFQLDGEPYCLACDRWTRVGDNLAAVAAHLAALRGIERWGVGDLRQAFAGYAALPPPEGSDWREVLGVGAHATRADIDQAWRRLRGQHHPDRGGDAAAFDRVAKAYERACAAVKS